VLAGIPEEEDLACLGGRLTTSPDLQCQILRLERLEGTRPPGYPRLVGVSFVTRTRLPRYVRVGDTSCVLRVSPKPIDPIRCYKCQGYGHYSNNCPSSDTCARCAGNHNTKRAAVGISYVQTAALSIQPPTGGARPFHFTRKLPQYRPRTAYPGRRLKSLLGPETGHQPLSPSVALHQGLLPPMDLGACA